MVHSDHDKYYLQDSYQGKPPIMITILFIFASEKICSVIQLVINHLPIDQLFVSVLRNVNLVYQAN